MIQWLVPGPSEHCLQARFCEPNCWEMSFKQGHITQRYMSYQHTGNVLPWTSHDVFRARKVSIVLLAIKGLSQCPVRDALIATAQTVGHWCSKFAQLLAANKELTLGSWVQKTGQRCEYIPPHPRTWSTLGTPEMKRGWSEKVKWWKWSNTITFSQQLVCLNRTWTDQGHVITIVEKQPSIIFSSPCIVFYLHTG